MLATCRADAATGLPPREVKEGCDFVLSQARLDVVVTFITEQTLRKTRHFNGLLRALASVKTTVKLVE